MLTQSREHGTRKIALGSHPNDLAINALEGFAGLGAAEDEVRLADLAAPAATSRLPLAVVDDDRLLGVIARTTLLTALGSAWTPDADTGADSAHTNGSTATIDTAATDAEVNNDDA